MSDAVVRTRSLPVVAALVVLWGCSGCYPYLFTVKPGATGKVVDVQSRLPIGGATAALATRLTDSRPPAPPLDQRKTVAGFDGTFRISGEHELGFIVGSLTPVVRDSRVEISALGYAAAGRDFQSSSAGPAVRDLGVIPLSLLPQSLPPSAEIHDAERLLAVLLQSQDQFVRHIIPDPPGDAAGAYEELQRLRNQIRKSGVVSIGVQLPPYRGAFYRWNPGTHKLSRLDGPVHGWTNIHFQKASPDSGRTGWIIMVGDNGVGTYNFVVPAGGRKIQYGGPELIY